MATAVAVAPARAPRKRVRRNKDLYFDPAFMPTIPITQAVTDFYITLLAGPLYHPDTTHEARRAVYDRVYARVVPPLVDAFFDYIVAACAGEMRHARGHCQRWYYPSPASGDRVRDRCICATKIERFEPISTLRAAHHLFTRCQWSGGGYGGAPWGRIAEAGLLRLKVPPSIFVDHCVDLTHNGGLFLDKQMIFAVDTSLRTSSTRYRTMLNFKKHAKTAKEFVQWLGQQNYDVSFDVLPLAARIMEENTTINGSPAWTYTRVKWGAAPFNLPLKSRAGEEESPTSQSQVIEGDNGNTLLNTPTPKKGGKAHGKTKAKGSKATATAKAKADVDAPTTGG